MVHPRIKRELLRSIGIFGIAMLFFLFFSINLNNYYWLIFIGPILIIIIYITLVAFWVKNKEFTKEESIILECHRLLVGSIIFIIFLTFSFPYLIFLSEFNVFSKLIFIIFVFFLILSIISVISNSQKIKSVIGKKKKLFKIQKKFAIREVLIGGVLVCILGIYIILASFMFILWIIPLIAIPAGLCFEILNKKLYTEIKMLKNK